MHFHIDGSNISAVPVVVLMIVFWVFGFVVHKKTYDKREFQKDEKSRILFIVGCAFFQALFFGLIVWIVWLLFFFSN